MNKAPAWLCVWEDNNKKDSVEPISQYVEENRVRLRAKYLKFIYELNRKLTNEQSIGDKVEKKSFISIWQMSLLAEKSPFKSPEITDCLKLFALEEIINNQHLHAIEVVGVTRKSVLEVITVLCCKLGVKVSFSEAFKVSENEMTSSISIYNKTPYFIQGVISMFRIVQSRWQLRKARMHNWFSGENTVFLMSYFIGLDYNAYKNGRFESHHWGALPELISSQGKSMNWMHHFLRQKNISDTASGVEWIETFNQATEQKGKHTFLYSYLTLSVAVQALLRWLGAAWRSLPFYNIKELFRPDDSVINLWPLFKNDWYKSFLGADAVQNALLYELFDKAIATLPKQNIGLYLYEGQHWEPAFIHAWRKHGHGELVAVQHSTVRFWDLRIFSDARIFEDERNFSIPLPDKIAVNGPIARKAFLDMGYSEEYLVDVEALRYIQYADSTCSSNRSRIKKVISSELKLLILGDIQQINTQPLFQLLSSLSTEIKNNLKITVKPHPAHYVEITDYKDLEYEVTVQPLKEILGMFDIALAANQTSAALDAFLYGLPVIVYQNISEFNFNPLRDIPGVQFVSTTDELAIILKDLGNLNNIEGNRDDYFNLDPELPRWRELLFDCNEPQKNNPRESIC